MGLSRDTNQLTGSPKCSVYEYGNYPAPIYWDIGPEYWGTDIPSIDSTTLKPSESAISYAELGDVTRKEHSGFVQLTSFIITVTIDNVVKKIVGFPEDLYRKLFQDKPPEFFNDVISYGVFYGADLHEVQSLDFKYNRCGVTGHTKLTNYLQFVRNAKFYVNLKVNAIDNISISFDDKIILSDSGYNKDLNICKLYEDEEKNDDIIDELPYNNSFPIEGLSYYFDNLPDNLIGRKYVLTQPDNITNLLGHGSDPE